jgi:uncharacterized protein (TIGR01777 family)
MNVLVTGASGLIGSSLVDSLRGAGWGVVRAVRRPASAPDEARWDPLSGMIEGGPPVGAVVHLAGASLDRGRWTMERKREIERSRIHATHGLCEWLARRPTLPATLVAASAIGYYGDAGDIPLDESSPPGGGWLASLAERWERACAPARQAGIRVVHLRFGLVLSSAGGALPPLLRVFRLGLGGPMGSGRQFWSWITLADTVAVLRGALEQPAFSGPINVVAPEPLPQREFARALGRALHRPAGMPAPALALRWLLGEMADALVLSSARVVPRRLCELGFTWRHPDLGEALRHVLSQAEVDGRPTRP